LIVLNLGDLCWDLALARYVGAVHKQGDDADVVIEGKPIKANSAAVGKIAPSGLRPSEYSSHIAEHARMLCAGSEEGSLDPALNA